MLDVACLVPRPQGRAEAIRGALAPLAELTDRLALTCYGHRGGLPAHAAPPARPLAAFDAEHEAFDAIIYVLEGAEADVRQLAGWAARARGVLLVPSSDALPLPLGEGQGEGAPQLPLISLARQSRATVVGDPRTYTLLAEAPNLCLIPAAQATNNADPAAIDTLRSRFGLMTSSYVFSAFGAFTTPAPVADMLAVTRSLGMQGYPVQLVLGGPVEGAAAALVAGGEAIVTGSLCQDKYRGLRQMSDVVFQWRAPSDIDSPYRLMCGTHPEQVVVELAAPPDTSLDTTAQAALLTELEHLMQSPTTRRRIAGGESTPRAIGSYAAQLWWSVLLEAARTPRIAGVQPVAA